NTSHRRSAMALGLPIQNGSTSHVAASSQIAIRASPRTSCAVTLVRTGISVEEAAVMIRFLAEPPEPRAAGSQRRPIQPTFQCNRNATCAQASVGCCVAKHEGRITTPADDTEIFDYFAGL